MYYTQYLLTVVGLAYFLTLSDLMKPIRMRFSVLNMKKIKGISWLTDKIDGVINCIYCASFWLGIVAYYLLYNDISKYTVLFPFSVMGLIYIVKNINPKQ